MGRHGPGVNAMPVLVEVASSSGSTMLSDWNSTLSLSCRKDGRVRQAWAKYLDDMPVDDASP
jgi:hypothetical protein